MSLHAVAWDIDGTLVDSEPLHHRALVAVCARYGLKIDPEDRSFVGVHISDVWSRLCGQLINVPGAHQWFRDIHEFYAKHSDTLAPMPGAVETIRTLAKAGILQVCVSNSDRATVDINLRCLGVSEFLHGVISLDDVPAGKPDPAPYRMAAQLLDLPPQKVLAVEDSATGARSARAAGLKVALAAVHTADKPLADFMLASLQDVPALLDLPRRAPCLPRSGIVR